MELKDIKTLVENLLREYPVLRGNDDILYYTHGENNDYSQSLHNDYGVSEKNLKIYTQNLVKPSFTVNEYDGFGDYMKYIQDVYGREESYAGHLMGLLDTRDLINDAHYETVYAKGAKTFADTINEIMQYYDVKSNMGKSSVGIVRNIDVSKAINGVTNVITRQLGGW